MMKHKLRFLLLLLLFGVLSVGLSITESAIQPSAVSFAQDDGDTEEACQSLVLDAIRSIGSACTTIGTNEVCYGNTRVSATLNDAGLIFDESGDIVAVTAVDAMVTRPANPNTREWGVALMNILADLPENTSDMLRLVMFGGVEVEPAAQSQADAERTTCELSNPRTGAINMRSGPGLDFAVVDILDPADSASAYGQSADGEWIRTNRGWVSAELSELACDAGDELPTIAASEDAYTAPMQAFTLQLSASGCSTAPSGLLVQAPSGQTANVRINNIELRVGSTAVLFPGQDNSLNIGNLGGNVAVTVNGSTEQPPVGQMTTINLDENGNGTGQASPSQPLSGLNLSADFLNGSLPERVAFVPGIDASVVLPGSPNTNTSGGQNATTTPIDSDGDGILDADDACPNLANDSIGDPCNPDEDGDSVLDGLDNCPFASNVDQGDRDGDGLGDACDAPDTDNDGVDDAADNCPTVPNAEQGNVDADAQGDACDDDDDNDGFVDGDDQCPVEAGTNPNVDRPGCPDADNDNFSDQSDNCPSIANPSQNDNDDDTYGDECDPNDDNDAYPDNEDGCPLVAGSSSVDPKGCPDADGDGVADSVDNCPTVANPDQIDTDALGEGDACDADDDNDGIDDSGDDCPLQPGSGTAPGEIGCPVPGVTIIEFNPNVPTCDSIVVALNAGNDVAIPVDLLVQNTGEVNLQEVNITSSNGALVVSDIQGALVIDESSNYNLTGAFNDPNEALLLSVTGVAETGGTATDERVINLPAINFTGGLWLCVVP